MSRSKRQKKNGPRRNGAKGMPASPKVPQQRQPINDGKEPAPESLPATAPSAPVPPRQFPRSVFGILAVLVTWDESVAKSGMRAGIFTLCGMAMMSPLAWAAAQVASPQTQWILIGALSGLSLAGGSVSFYRMLRAQNPGQKSGQL